MGNKNLIIQKLSKEVSELKNQLSTKKPINGFSVENSLSDLIVPAGYQSPLTSMAPSIQNNNYSPVTINHNMLTYMYKSQPLIQTIVDIPIDDAFRGGIELNSNELSANEIKKIQDILEGDGVLDRFIQTLKWARLYGGGAMLINTEQDPTSPLQYKNINELEFYATNRWELYAPRRLEKETKGTLKLDYAPIMTDYYYFYGQKVHKSRVFTFIGKEAPWVIRWQLSGWGMSIVERLLADNNIYLETKNLIYECLSEFKIDYYRFEGLSGAISSDEGTAGIKKRIQIMNQMKNYQNAVVLDKNDEFEQKQLTFAGLGDMSKENRINIASAFRIPMTKLFGISSAGFNSGEDDIENYNAMLESEVRQPSRSKLRNVLELIFAKEFGFIPEFSFEFKPLRIMNSVEEESVNTSKQNRILSLYDRGLIDSNEASEMLKKDKLIDIETKGTKGLLDEFPTPPVEQPTVRETVKEDGNLLDEDAKAPTY